MFWMSTHQILSLSNSEWTESCHILANMIQQTVHRQILIKFGMEVLLDISRKFYVLLMNFINSFAFINTPHWGATQLMAIRCIPEVQLQQFVYRELTHPSLNFQRGGKSKSAKFEPPAFENAARYRNFETKCNVAMIVLCPRQLWWSWVHAPPRTMSVAPNPAKLHGKTCYIVNNSAVDYSISLKYCTEFERMTREVP